MLLQIVKKRRKTCLLKQFLINIEWKKLGFLIIQCPAEHASIVQLLANKKIHNQILRIKHKIDNIHYNDIEMAFVTSSGVKFIETSTNSSITMYLV